MYVIRLLVGLTVEVNYAVLYLQRLSGQTNATLNIVLTPIDGAPYNIAIRLSIHLNPGSTIRIYLLELAVALERGQTVELNGSKVLLIHLSTLFVAHTIVVAILARQCYRIARRIVEYDYVVELYGLRRNTFILPLRPRDVTLYATQW